MSARPTQLVAAIAAAVLAGATAVEACTGDTFASDTDGGGGDASNDAADGDAGLPHDDAGPEDAASDARADGGPSYATVVAADTPLAYWRLDEVANSTMVTSEVGSYAGVVRDGVTLGVPGVAGSSAARFDGTSGTIVLGDVLGFAGDAPFTMELWMKPTRVAVDEWRRPLARDGVATATDGGRDGYTFYVEGKVGVGFDRLEGSQVQSVRAGAPTSPPTTWQHVVVTYDGTTIRLYLNGLLVTSSVSTAPLATTSIPLILGNRSDPESLAYYEGDLDEVAVYDRPLDGARIAAHYAAGQ